MDIFNNLLDFFYILINICESLYNWLFTPVSIAGYTFTPIFVGGSIVVAIMIIRFIGSIV